MVILSIVVFGLFVSESETFSRLCNNDVRTFLISTLRNKLLQINRGTGVRTPQASAPQSVRSFQESPPDYRVCVPKFWSRQSVASRLFWCSEFTVTKINW